MTLTRHSHLSTTRTCSAGVEQLLLEVVGEWLAEGVDDGVWHVCVCTRQDARLAASAAADVEAALVAGLAAGLVVVGSAADEARALGVLCNVDVAEMPPPAGSLARRAASLVASWFIDGIGTPSTTASFTCVSSSLHTESIAGTRCAQSA